MSSTQMAREIAEQPEALRRTLAALLPRRAAVAELFEGRRRVLFVARGSSDNAAIYGRYLLETHAGVPGGLASPSVATHYRSRLDLSDTLVVSVSQSGATEEIVATQQWARSCGAATLAVANVAGSPLVAAADLGLVTEAGPEVAVPATKTYLAQLAAMAVLGTALAPDPTSLDPDLERAVVGIGGDATFAGSCAVHVPGPELPETLAPLGAIVPAQLVVERLALTLGLDPDHPSGLAKVTSTDPHS